MKLSELIHITNTFFKAATEYSGTLDHDAVIALNAEMKPVRFENGKVNKEDKEHLISTLAKHRMYLEDGFNRIRLGRNEIGYPTDNGVRRITNGCLAISLDEKNGVLIPSIIAENPKPQQPRFSGPRTHADRTQEKDDKSQ